MVEECLEALPEQFAPLHIGLSKKALREMPDFLVEKWQSQAQKALESPLVPILATDWLRFSRTGDRARYENVYFARRRRLSDLVCGSLLDGKEAYLDAILDTVWAICEESAWQVPAHNLYVRDTLPYTWPDTTRPVVDLFAAETGALLTCTAALLGERLPEEVRRRIFLEVEKRILIPYQTNHFWWMGNEGEMVNNWAPWCTQNVLLCAFGLPFAEDVRHKVIAQSAHTLDRFLDLYGTDGCCNEGAQYYSHAGLCLFGCLNLLTQVTPGCFDVLWREEKIRNIAAYIHHVHVSGPYYVNFADCSPVAGRRGAREYLFARKTGNEQLARFAAQDWMTGTETSLAVENLTRVNLWYQLLEAENAADMVREAAKEPACPAGEIYYPSAGVFLARRGDWTLAAKAGNNAESHNHNDTGSVILYRGGEPVLIDLGVETYTKKTFSPQRYEIWTMQSQWHNLPTFDEVQQKDGAQFCARDVVTDFGPEAAQMDMELSAAWPDEAGLDSFHRSVRLTPEGFRMEDHCRGRYQNAFLSLMLREKPRVNGSTVILGELAELILTGVTGPIETDVLPITDARLRSAWPDTLYRLRIPFDRELTAEIR